MTKSWHISRRTMLYGAGAAVALPWLEAMSAAQDAPPKAGQPPLRVPRPEASRWFHLV